MGTLQNESTRSGTLRQANAKAYAATKRRRNCCDACRDVFSWHRPRQRPVSAPKCADTNRIDTNRIVGVAGAFRADHPYLAHQAFEPEIIETMSAAFVATCDALHLKVSDDPATRFVAEKVINLAQRGIRDPDALSTMTLKELSKSKPIPFACPFCKAEYEIVTIEAYDVQRGKISCLR